MAPALVLLSLLAATPEAPRLIVLDLQHLGAATQAEARSLDDVVVDVASRNGLYQVLSQRDVATLLGVERQKQLLGCDESASCLTELTGALDARFVLSGSLNKLGSSYQLTLQALDTRKNQPVGRSVRTAKSVDQLRGLLPWAVAEATGTPAPKAPSRVLPILLMVAGGLALAAGGVATFQAEVSETAIVRELRPGAVPAALPRTLQDYRDSADELARTKSGALLFLVAGAVAAAAGIWWFASIPDAAGGRVALVPTGTGLALVGGF
jgi:hypothetical protein